MTRGQRKWISFGLGLTISIVAVWLFLRGVDYRGLVGALSRANYWWLLPNIFFVMFAMYQRAYRWYYMLLPVKPVKFSNLLAATCIGFMANNVLPLRLGEIVRAYSLSYQDREVSKSASLATIFIERMVFDLVALLIIFGGVLTVTTRTIGDDMKQGLYIAILIALVGIALVAYLALRPEQAGNYLTKYLFFVPERGKEIVRAVVKRFSTGLAFVTQGRIATSVALQTLFLWLCMGFSNYFVFLAFGFKLPLEASYFLLVVVSVSILIPSSPGFIGVYHVAAVLTLSQYGIGGDEAKAFALVLHAAQYIPITLMGFYYLKKEHLSLRQLEAAAGESPAKA